MNIEEKRNEVMMLIKNIKEHSSRLTDSKNIPLLELSAILSKTTKLHENLAILKYMLEQKQETFLEDDFEEELEDNNVEEILVPDIEEEEEELEEIETETQDSEESEMPIWDQVEEEEASELENSEAEREEEQEEVEEILTTEIEETEENTQEEELSFTDIEEREELSSQPDLNEAFSEREDSSLSEQLKKQPIGDLLSAIALNERYVYANELFDGDIEDFRRVMGVLNEFETKEEASNFFDRELRQNYNWGEENEMADALFQLVERRFQS